MTTAYDTPAVLAVAPNGARRGKVDHAALPLTPAELAQAAAPRKLGPESQAALEESRLLRRALALEEAHKVEEHDDLRADVALERFEERPERVQVESIRVWVHFVQPRI